MGKEFFSKACQKLAVRGHEACRWILLTHTGWSFFLFGGCSIDVRMYAVHIKKNSSRVYQLDCWWDDQFTQSDCSAAQIKSLYGGDAMKISRAYRDFQISLPPILSIFLTDTLLLMWFLDTWYIQYDASLPSVNTLNKIMSVWVTAHRQLFTVQSIVVASQQDVW